MAILNKLEPKYNFINALPADVNKINSIRKVEGAAYSFVEPEKPVDPKLRHVSDDLLKVLSLENINKHKFLGIVSGKDIIPNTKPFAMNYAGHQFGHWAGQLGDGRAINLGEFTVDNSSWMLQLKGAGKTPYSRSADGLAVLRSSIREYLCSEAMHHLNVPTTRALSLVTSGKKVLRDILYDGHPAYEEGAIVCRAAKTFLRFGSLELFAANNDVVNLKKLADYIIDEFYPEVKNKSSNKYLDLFRAVSIKTMNLIIDWQRVGFVHGVMNTDNMSIIGDTIDFGPYGWLEDYNPGWTPNTTDAQNKRYRYGNQASVSLWNLTQLANALYEIVNDEKGLTDILSEFKVQYRLKYLKMMLKKIGILSFTDKDEMLIKSLTDNLYQSSIDMTIFFRNLTKFEGDVEAHLKIIYQSSYLNNEEFKKQMQNWKDWLVLYKNRLSFELENQNKVAIMNACNPKFVLRNYMAQLAIEAAEKNDYSILEELYQLLKKPYEDQPEMEKWFVKRPSWAMNKVGSSMLSCSS